MIVRDFGHSSENESLFQGPGLIKELNALLSSKP